MTTRRGDLGAVWCISDRRYLSQRMPQAMIDALASRDVDLRLVVIDDETVRVQGGVLESPLEEMAPGDVVVSRSRHPFALTLLHRVGRLGCDVITPSLAVDTVRDKARGAGILAECGVPTPETLVAPDVRSFAGLDPSWFPLVLKPHLGDNARGVTVVASAADLDGLEWRDGLVLAQRWIDTGGWDVKVYVCGDTVWAVRRPSPLTAPRQDDVALPVAVTPELRVIAHACRDAFGLPLCGIDVVDSGAGPRVVDVNDFPNYTGVAEAPEAVADLLEARLRLAAPAARLATVR